VTINGNDIQNINNVSASTTVSARSGQTVVFAGLIETTKSTDVRGIPFLSGIPVLGHLFKFTQDVERRRELLIVLTPHVIRGDDDIDRIRMAESERMSWCLTDVMALYGCVGLGAREGAWCDCETEVPMIFPDANPTGAELIPPPMPAINENSSSAMPPPGRTSLGRSRELEPSAPGDAGHATPGPMPAPAIANTGFHTPPPADSYPGAMLGYQGVNQVPPAPPAGPPLPNAAPLAHDPYTAARRLPQPP
jgi:hypothetical protein